MSCGLPRVRRAVRYRLLRECGEVAGAPQEVEIKGC
jgi:hypothetical protein